MGIFSNILDTAKSAVSKVGSTISNVLNLPTSNQTASSIPSYSLYQTTQGSGGFGESTLPTITPKSPSLSQNISTNPIINAANSGGTIRPATLPKTYSLNTQQPTASTQNTPMSYNITPGSASVPSAGTYIQGQEKLGMPTTQQASQTRQAITGSGGGSTTNRSSNNVAPPGYQFVGGKLVPLPQGVTGAAGITSDFSSYFGTGGVTTPSSIGGTSGIGGGMSNFLGITGTGNIGSVGGPLISEEEKQGITTKTTPTPHTPLITSLFGALNPPKPEAPLDTTVPPEISTDTSGTETYSGAANMDENTLNQQISNAVSYKVNQLNTVNPVPDNAVVDTQEQIDFLNQFPPQEQYDIRAQMDQIKLNNGYSDFVKQKADAQNTLAAINEEYTKVIDDIKANPDMPKALAQRRIDAVMEKYKFAQMQVMAVMEQAQTQMDAIDALIGQEFQIANFEEAQKNRQEDNARQMLNMIIESGAIAGYSDTELQKMSDSSGIPVEGLKKLRESIIKNDEIEYQKALADIAKTNRTSTSSGGSSSSAGTAGERATQAASSFASAFVPGATYEGKVILDSNGFINVNAWKAAIADAPSNGLSREQFIEMFGYLIPTDKNGRIDDSYGLTAKEKKIITG